MTNKEMLLAKHRRLLLYSQLCTAISAALIASQAFSQFVLTSTFWVITINNTALGVILFFISLYMFHSELNEVEKKLKSCKSE